MALTASISLNVPALPDNDVWFINAAAWSNYWQNINLAAEFAPAQVTTYEGINYDTTLPPFSFNVNGTASTVPSLEMFDSLRQKLDALDLSYRDLRTQLVDAGFIEEA